MPNKVFISYRREDSQYQARRVYDAFVHALPPDTVFMDVDTIPPGTDFIEVLEGWVQQCDVLLALIGPNWLTSIDPRTSLRRVDNPEDFVRIEVRGALQRKIPVVPVLLDATEMPTAADLPDDIKALRRRHAEFVDFRTFDADVQRLIRRLKLGKKNELPAEAPGPQAGNNGSRRTDVAGVNAFPERIKGITTAKPVLLAAAALLLLAVGVIISIMRDGTQTDVSARDFDLSEQGRRLAEARAGEATSALGKAEKARQEAEAAATAAAAAQARSEEGRRAAETRAGEAAGALAKAEKARSEAEAKASAAAAAQFKAEEYRRVTEARANDAAEALKKSEKARQEAETKLAAVAKAEESRASPQKTAGSPSLSPRKLLTDVGSKSRWAIDGNCNSPKDASTFSLEAGGGSITWVDGLGGVNSEKVVVSYEDAFYTTSDKRGYTRAYSRNGDSLYVQAGGHSGFTLKRCP